MESICFHKKKGGMKKAVGILSYTKIAVLHLFHYSVCRAEALASATVQTRTCETERGTDVVAETRTMIEMLGKNVGTVAEENKKLNKVEVGKTWKLSSVQIHVKKVIGLLQQKYTMLEATLPINTIMIIPGSEYSIVDKIISVCAGLFNCYDYVVSLEINLFCAYAICVQGYIFIPLLM